MKKLRLSISILFLLLVGCNLMEMAGIADSSLDSDFLKGGSLYKDLFGFWRFEEASGTYYSNNLKSFTENIAIPKTTGIRGSSLNCGGTSSGSSFTSSAMDFSQAMNAEFAISFWINKSSNPFGGCAGTEVVLVNSTDTFKIEFENIDCQNDAADMQVYFNGAYRTFNNDLIDFAANPGWHHFVINFYSSGNAELFIDGNSKGTLTNPIASAAISILNFGICSGNGGVSKLQGSIDSLGMWHRSLNQSEIYDLATGGDLY